MSRGSVCASTCCTFQKLISVIIKFIISLSLVHGKKVDVGESVAAQDWAEHCILRLHLLSLQKAPSNAGRFGLTS